MMLKNIFMLKHPITDIYICFCENEKKTALFLNIYKCNVFFSFLSQQIHYN